MGISILIHKTGVINHPGDWGPITLTSVVCGIIFGRIARAMISNQNRSVRKGQFSMNKKGFFPMVNGLGGHIAVINIATNLVMMTYQILQTLALDMLN
jgi:hypothetical protein